MKLLIDGDIVVYSCGHASDTREYIINDQSFKYKKEAVQYCKDNKFDKDKIEKVVTHSSEEECLSNVTHFINRLRETCDYAMEYTVYLTGKDNFREKVAVTVPYKGNRDDSQKPFHYAAIREYLLRNHRGVLVDGMEADDAMGIAQWKSEQDWSKTCIVSTDKDLNMIPGTHYNWQKDLMYDIDPYEADYFFHKQLLMGDPIDNIIGIKGIGDKTADKILAGKGWDERAYIIKQQYDKAFGVQNGLTRYNENYQLLWILREEMT